MDSVASVVAPGAAGVRFLPFLAGQVAPDARPGATAAFTGMRTGHDRATLYRAVLEGVAFSIRSIFDQIRASCGEPTVIRLTGSGVRSALWCGIIANTLNRTLEASDEAVEGRGAAVLTLVALGMYRDYDTAGAAVVPIKHHYEPEPAFAAVYADLYDDWRRVAEATRPLDRPAGK
jgi:sugar (pentulose or hexulose) kinase